ncbi:MAG: amidase [Kordiimonas sp.]
MDLKPLHTYSATELANFINTGQISAEQTVKHFLSRIEKHDDKVGAFVFLDKRSAIEAAREVDRKKRAGEPLGLLAGVPFGVKDFTHVQGMPTAEGSRLFEPTTLQPTDEPIIARLKAEGAIPIGKTNVPEFGMHSATYNETYGISRNPWDITRTPGGSSGGSSAAVAAGLVPFATGTDGGGSIRTPAAFCGLVGLKTTHALIPRREGQSSLSCLGFLTKTVEDTARLIDITCGSHPSDKMSLPKPHSPFEQALDLSKDQTLKAVWSSDFGYAPMEPEIVEVAHSAYEKLTNATTFHTFPYSFEPNNVYRAWILDSLNFLKETLETDGFNLATPDSRTQRLLSTYSKSSTSDHLYVQQQFAELEKYIGEFFLKADLLFTPATSCPAFGAHEEIPDIVNSLDATWTGAEPLSMFANVAGLPAISIPAGFTKTGLPVGLQIVAARHNDLLLLQLARLWEKIQPWPLIAPDYS